MNLIPPILLILLIIFVLLLLPLDFQLPLVKIGGSSQKTYLISSNGKSDHTELLSELHDRGYKPYVGQYVKNGYLKSLKEKLNIKYVDFLLVEYIAKYNGYAKNTYEIKCDWLSLHDIESIKILCLKDKLHKALSGSDIIAKTWLLKDFVYDDKVYILRPSNPHLHSGMEIKIVYDRPTMEEARQFYAEKEMEYQKLKKEHTKRYKVIVSEYIMDPMLFNGRKFHLRLYGINLSTKKGFFIDRNNGEILTAAEPYIAGDWDNKSIHDTHMSSTDGVIIFPDQFPDQKMLPEINKQLDIFEKELTKISHPKPYSNAKKSFHIFGLDVMIDNAGRLILIEINSKPGLDTNTVEGTRETSKRLWKWLFKYVE